MKPLSLFLLVPFSLRLVLFWLLFVGCFFSLFCGLIVVTGSRLRKLRKAKQRFLKRFLKGLLESVSPGPYLPYTTKQHWHLSLPSFFTNMQHNLSSFPQILSLPLFHLGLILFLLPLACSFNLAPSHVLKAVFPLLTSLSFIPVLTPLCLSLWCLSPLFSLLPLHFYFTHSLLCLYCCFSCLPLTFSPVLLFPTWFLFAFLFLCYGVSHFILFTCLSCSTFIVCTFCHLSLFAWCCCLYSVMPGWKYWERTSQTVLLRYIRNKCSFCCLFLKCNLKPALIISATLLKPTVLLQRVPDRWVAFRSGHISRACSQLPKVMMVA